MGVGVGGGHLSLDIGDDTKYWKIIFNFKTRLSSYCTCTCNSIQNTALHGSASICPLAREETLQLRQWVPYKEHTELMIQQILMYALQFLHQAGTPPAFSHSSTPGYTASMVLPVVRLAGNISLSYT